VSDSVRRQLLFEVGEHLFAVDARNVREVLEPTEATPVPGSVPGILGLMNLRGTLVVAGDLATLLGLTSRKSEETALVVFEHESDRVALEVDRLSGVAPYPTGDLDVDGELLEVIGAREIVAGVGQLGSRPYFQLEMKALFARVLEQDTDRDRAIQLGSIGGWEQR
jgi:chemotaxis signal transduction protein